MKGYRRPTESSLLKGQTRPDPLEYWRTHYPKNASQAGNPFLSVENANKLRRAKLARMQNGNRANSGALKPQWVLNVEKEVELARQNKLKRERDEATTKASKKAQNEALRIAMQRNEDRENAIAMKQLEEFEKKRNAALKARYNAENEARYALQNELNRERKAEWKKKAMNAARNEALRNAASRANRARNEALEAAWWASQNATTLNARPAATRPANIAQSLPLALPIPSSTYSNTNVAALLDVIAVQNKRIYTAAYQMNELRDEMIIFEKFWSAAEKLNKSMMMRVSPTPDEFYLQNNQNKQVQRQIVRQRKNIHFLQRLSRTRNAWVITRNDIKGVKFGMVAKGLEAARRNRSLPREATGVIGAVDRLRKAYQKAVTPQQMRAWLGMVHAYVMVTHEMMPIFRIAKELAKSAYMLEASHHAQIVGSMKLLPPAAMSYLVPALTPYRNDRTKSLRVACNLIMMTLIIAAMLLFVYLRKMRLIRR